VRHLPRLLIASLLLIVPGFSQTITASLEGDVRDSTGATVPGARVRVINADTNVAASLVTGPDGRFVAPALSSGRYSVVVEAAGFKKAERSGIVLQVNQSARIELILEVGAITETVEITGAAPLLESTSSAIGQVIDNRTITN